MHTTKLKVFFLFFTLWVFGSGQQETKTNGGTQAAQNTNQNGDTNSANQVINSGSMAFYSGFDGVNDYSLLLPGFRDYTIADPSVATITKENITLSESTIATLMEEVKTANPDFDDTQIERFRGTLTRQQSAYRITPLKAGTTILQSTRGGRGGKDSWGSGSTGIQLTVNSYTPEQYAAGAERYNTGGSGLLKACKSCHETGESGAPSHELGNIKEISDSQGIQWITTGQLNSHMASIAHTWEFGSEEQQLGILPYLRAKGSKDLETFTKLVIEERLQNFQLPPGGGPPGP